MVLDIEHSLHFEYSDFISESWVELRMEPRTTKHQSVSSYFLAVGPRTRVFRFEDWLGNSVRHFSIAEYHNEIEGRARSIVETTRNQVDLANFTEMRTDRSEMGPMLDFLEFGGPITVSAALREVYDAIGLPQNSPIGERALAIGTFVNSNFAYQKNVTTYKSAIDEALRLRAGVCQDLAQIMIGLLRLDGIPARYVNGYLHVEHTDAAESHAWVEFYVAGRGWIGFDPTAGAQPDERHVVVAVGSNYNAVPPNQGIYRGSAKEKLRAKVHTVEIAA